MIIQIDVREKELILQISILTSTIPLFKDLIINAVPLPLGDIIFLNEETNAVELYVERKSINDLLASIKDGRYEEQSYRLNGLPHSNHNIIYLIEGDVNKVNRFKDNHVEKLTMYSAIFSLNYFKGFSVIRTFNLEETAIFLCNTLVKLIKERNKKAYYKNVNEINEVNEDIPTDKDYVSVIKKVKKENITVDNIGEIMLSQIPGISSITALAILKEYKSITNLLKELEKNPKCLENISYLNTKGQIRKINKSSGSIISKYLFG
jgi:ERCC4-type nuclease